MLGTATGRSNLADIHHVDLTDEANDRTLLLSLLLGNIQTQIQTAIQTAINNFLAALGLPVAGRSLNRQFPLLESLTGSGGGDLLGSLTGGEELFGGLTGDLGGLGKNLSFSQSICLQILDSVIVSHFTFHL